MKTPLQPLALLLLVTLAAHAQVNSGSNGSDGAFNPATNVVINMADHPTGIYHYTSVNIFNGVTVTFIPNANNAAAKKGFEQPEHDDCRQNLGRPVPDPNYTQVPSGRPVTRWVCFGGKGVRC